MASALTKSASSTPASCKVVWEGVAEVEGLVVLVVLEAPGALATGTLIVGSAGGMICTLSAADTAFSK